MDGKDIFQCRASNGMANIIGNATLVVRDFIKGLFPKDFFKDEFIDTSMVQTEVKNITKKKTPCLVIRPKFSLNEDDTFFGKLPDWINTNYFIYKNLKDNYLPVLKDDENQIYVYCSGDRIKINFDIEIVTDSKQQQINTAWFLKGSVLHKSPFYINKQRLETEVPKYFTRQIASILKYDLTNQEERINFNNYLNENSYHFITEKIKLSTGNNSHFYLFSANLLSMFNDYPDIDDGESTGMTYDSFKITESFSVDFWCPFNYFLEVGRKFDRLDYKNYNFIDEQNEISVHYTMRFDLPEKYDDMDYVKKITYITDDNIKEDVVSIAELFDAIDKKVIQYARDKKVLPKEVFHINLYLDGYMVDTDFVQIDWDNYELKNIRPKINENYTLVVYRSQQRYNRILQLIDNLEGNNYNK